MHPQNVPCLTAARIDVCALANNHVLDYGYAGLDETLHTLDAATIHTAGAGLNLDQARRPAILPLGHDCRVIVFSCGTETSGIPAEWAATPERPGVDRLDDLSTSTASDILDRVQSIKRPGDVVIASIHWGSNWGFEVPPPHVRFAHQLLDGEVDLVHGHSSHHPRAMEVYNHKLVLYGCGDFLNDYEGIGGYEPFRPELSLMYFPTIDSRTGALVELRMTPMQIRRLQVVHASPRDARWLRDVLTLASQPFDSQLQLDQDGRLTLRIPTAARR
jgi:poly-gamma-glutamate synthesis protein (capsule biosynthesis protein)